VAGLVIGVAIFSFSSITRDFLARPAHLSRAFFKIVHLDESFPASVAPKGGFIDDGGQIRAAEPGVARASRIRSYVRPEFHRSAVDLENIEPSLQHPAAARKSAIESPGRVSAGSSTSHAICGPRTTITWSVVSTRPSRRGWRERLLALVVATGAESAAARRPTASISSRKMMQGLLSLACLNRSRTRLAPTPTNISTKSEPLIEKNGTSASPAMALARSVLPVPGSPH